MTPPRARCASSRPLAAGQGLAVPVRRYRAGAAAYRAYPVRRKFRHPGPLAARLDYQVTYCRNVTDIDDKILQVAGQEGVPWWAVAERNQRAFTRAYDALGCLPPDVEPRATGHVPEMIVLMQRLIDSGHAYAAGGDVYFDVQSLPELRRAVRPAARAHAGRRRHRGRRCQARPARLRAVEGAPSPASRPGRHRGGLVAPAGTWSARRCRPSTSAPTFDIHGGGLDLLFPHHENEQAQSHAAGRRLRPVLAAQRPGDRSAARR